MSIVESQLNAVMPFDFPRTAHNAHLRMMQMKKVWFTRVTGNRAVLVAENVDQDENAPYDDCQFLRNDFSTGYVRTCIRPYR